MPFTGRAPNGFLGMSSDNIRSFSLNIAFGTIGTLHLEHSKEPTMNPTRIILTSAVVLALAGCANMTPDQRFAAGGLAGGAAGLAIADHTKADKTGKIVGTLAGAAIGSSLAASSSSSTCRYPNGTIGPCSSRY